MRTYFPVATIEVVGPLSVRTAATLRRTIAKCLTEQPGAIVLDLAGIELIDGVAGRIFATAAHQAARWPGCPVVAHSAPPSVAAALNRLGVHRHMPVFGDRAATFEHIVRCPAPTLLTDELPAGPEAARLARALVRTACERWGQHSLVSDAEVVATELVANAVCHASGPLRITVSRLDRFVHVALRDGTPTRPRRQQPAADDSTSGRGLAIVDAFAERWGSAPVPGGKVVWATFQIGTPPRPDTRPHPELKEGPPVNASCGKGAPS